MSQHDSFLRDLISGEIMVFGLLLLLNNLVANRSILSIFWPLTVLIAGIIILLRQYQKDKEERRFLPFFIGYLVLIYSFFVILDNLTGLLSGARMFFVHPLIFLIAFELANFARRPSHTVHRFALFCLWLAALFYIAENSFSSFLLPFTLISIGFLVLVFSRPGIKKVV